jgi:hypothetical protein
VPRRRASAKPKTGDRDCAGHHESQRRVPSPEDIEEAEYFPGVRHARDQEADAEHETASKADENK